MHCSGLLNRKTMEELTSIRSKHILIHLATLQLIYWLLINAFNPSGAGFIMVRRRWLGHSAKLHMPLPGVIDIYPLRGIWVVNNSGW